MAGRKNTQTFSEWVVNTIKFRKPLTLFNDAFHSPISVNDLAKVLFEMIDRRAYGLVNVAAHDVISKADFIRGVASGLDIELDWAYEGSITQLAVPRADSAGLDVTYAEQLVGHALPTSNVAISNIVDVATL
jgi:dTDP-4-dehydrorhamnose reductase